MLQDSDIHIIIELIYLIMPTCPGCGDETTKRMAIIEPSDIKEEREYCITCEKYIDDDARPPSNE